MARIRKNPLLGVFANTSMFFLNDNGFTNKESCSDKSVWVGEGIQLFIDPEDVVTDYDKLFRLIYDSGVNYGKWVERKGLMNSIQTFIHNYGRKDSEKSDY